MQAKGISLEKCKLHKGRCTSKSRAEQMLMQPSVFSVACRQFIVKQQMRHRQACSTLHHYGNVILLPASMNDGAKQNRVKELMCPKAEVFKLFTPSKTNI